MFSPDPDRPDDHVFHPVGVAVRNLIDSLEPAPAT
jgi:hypothetical protein